MLPAANLDNKIKEFWPKCGPSTQKIEKYVKKYSKEKIVIKCGGRVLLDADLFNSFIEDVVILKKLGLTPLLVHGGGLGIKKKLDELNIESKFVMGLRVTNEKLIKIVEDVMIEFNKEIVDALEKKMCKAKSVTVKENNAIYVEQKNKVLASNLKDNIEYLDKLRYMTVQMKVDFLKEVEHELLAVALRLSSKELIYELFSEVTERMQDEFLDKLQSERPASAVCKAQDQLLKLIREKEGRGEIVLDPTAFITYV